ncbi:glycosyltransferase family 2 protein [Aetokthonos hydrillicola Thurmond2011]|jgi:cellulose synthase/poly-beta-1,6-N-acetylglucosamine synthase-like glycosyltransferase|uniref:Glycosyltransferase family 2 protein n=1 Tax=Aetokthonos hydrillicola Thurmond2011 TaxID=2712845 RepID=A0AAP5I9L1_9CYAN|nr:glycosyltransferase family 2 protein [Aetokthonos hydrillicola]MBO3463385.1 glycosyltransferase family 2 protein [Aetokthonos hydrillicola CCALA 1050]MBW4586287.1 glycosyltransferase family 2 protein [Aetokthonos hydrillicola CCALA 1050]MDR9897415.1 glycosyltransferase family 2 protein [Aetokthonos hydrillicola Thurmond2011]
MKELAILLCIVLLGWLVIQVSLCVLFLLHLRSPRRKLLSDQELPKTAVVLSLRGADPFLSDCLRSLLNQNYPEYDLKIILDSQQDPAWRVVADILSDQEVVTDNVHVSILRTPYPNSSLKCSSLVQAVSKLDDSYKVVAFVDADAVVHSNWLRELVSPLAHPKVGATTGNPWYLPTGKYWGSSVRYLWNVFAVVKMYLHRIPWGGSLAVKTEVIHTTGLLDKWKRAYSEDTIIPSVLARHGMQVVFVPSLIILNHEESDFSHLLDSSKRQLLSYRLYHPRWWAVIADSILTVVLPHLVLVLILVALWTRQWDVAVIFLNSLGVYMQVLLFFVIALEKEVQLLLPQHGQQLTKISATTMMKLSIASLLTLWVYGLGMVSALWMKQVKWRGVTYRVRGAWDIRVLKYYPYQLFEHPNDNQVSR